MRVARYAITEIDRYLEEAQRAKNRLDFDRWRAELRPRAMHLFASRVATLRWSRALLKAVVAELYPDDLFSELVGSLDPIPTRHWPDVIAFAVALRHSWRHDRPAKLARRLHVSLPKSEILSGRLTANHPSPTITPPIVWLASRQSRLSASLRPRAAGLTALTGTRSSHAWALT